MATPLTRHVFLLCFTVFASISMASYGFGEETQIPEPVNPGLNYLCEGYKLFFNHCKPFVEEVARVWKMQQS